MAGVALALALAPSGAVAPQEAPGTALEPTELELTAPVRAQLAHLQDLWLEWLSANFEGDEAAAELALGELQAGAGRLGMARLPDLSLGASAQAVRLSRDGAFDKAGRALAAAERLDPGLPETALARAAVERRRGGWGVGATLDALRRLGASGVLRRIALANTILVLLGGLLLAGFGFVAVQMATRGRQLVARAMRYLRRSLPGPLALALTVVLLLWPIVLPSGPLWLAVYWAVLLWGMGRTGERVVLAALLLLLGVAPMLVNEQRKAVSLSLSAPAQAAADAAERRLTGTLFSDLGVLRAVLPDSAAVRHLLADLYATMGQWSQAREHYLAVLEAEPGNVAAIVDAGVCFYQQADYEAAIDYLGQATATAAPSASAYFNLSQTHNKLYQFQDAQDALARAQELAPQAVGDWILAGESAPVVGVFGGFGRTGEIRGDLARAWRAGEVGTSWATLGGNALSLPLAVLFVAIAVVLHFVLGRTGAGKPTAGETVAAPPTWLAALTPGYAEARQRRWRAAVLALLGPGLLAALALLRPAAFGLPWLFPPPASLLVGITVVLLLLWLAVRLVRQRLA